MPDLTPLDALKSFCSRNTEDPRPYRHHPIRTTTHAFGVDGSALLCVPLAMLDDPAEITPVVIDDPWFIRKDMRRLIDRAKAKAGELHPLPAIPTKIPCKRCGGDGLSPVKAKCDECDANGEFVHGSHWYSCAHCDGDGMIASSDPGAAKSTDTCQSCSGFGEPIGQPVQIGTSYMARLYLARIAALPGARIATPIGDVTEPIYFTCDFGDGVVMPYIYPKAIKPTHQEHAS